MQQLIVQGLISVATPTITPIPDPIAPALAPVSPQSTGLTHRIFLCSTYVDLIEHRRVVHDRLERIEQHAVDMSQFSAGGDAATVSTNEVATADYVVLIVAWRYGSIPTVPPGETRSITHQEYEEARRLGKPIFVFLADPATELNERLFPSATRDREHTAQLHAFRALLANPNFHTPDYFTTPEDLGGKVSTRIAGYLLNLQPAVPSIIAARSGLPRAAGLVGRDHELDTLAAALTAANAPVGVFAIEGIAGVGKTALAAEAVARLAEHHAADFPGGFAWISCEDLAGPDGLAELWRRVAEELQLRQIAEEADPEERRVALTAALAARPRTLIALDNVEPALPADALLDALAVPDHVALLLTARDAIPDTRLTPLFLTPLAETPAAKLFARILAQNSQNTRPTAEERPEIDAIVEELGGLPLAIELTAAYAGVQGFSLHDIRAQHRRDGFNAAAFRGNPRKAIVARFDRSWDVLTPAQQRLFAGLALISGPSFPRAAANALAQAALDVSDQPDQPNQPPTSSADANPEAAVAALVTLRLVEPLASATGPRLRLHPLLREYAAARLGQLPAPTTDRLGDTIVAYWLEYAEDHPGYDGMNALEAENFGLMGALAWAHDHARHRNVLALAHALGTAWDVRGHRSEEVQMYTWADEAAHQANDLKEQQWAIHQLSVTYSQLGRIAEARDGFVRALALAQQLGDPSAERAEVHSLAVLDAQAGLVAEARAGYEQSLTIVRRLGDSAAEQQEPHNLAALDARTGKVEQARAGFEQALALAQQLGDPAAEMAEIYSLAVLDSDARRLPEARAGFYRAQVLARQLGDPRAEQAAVHEIALLDAQVGRLSDAHAGFERALTLARQLGDPSAEASELLNLGIFTAQQGEVSSGRAMIEQSLAIAQRLGDVYQIALCHQSLARLYTDIGERPNALAHYREALRTFEQVGSPEAESVRDSLRRLGSEP
jgi:tetratricopeptide (TPR) repeat protein